MNIKESQTLTVNRSQIRFAAYNPRVNNPEVVKSIKQNFKRVGFLGGIVWNEVTGNLISGHKRVEALDIINKYDGTPEKDYPIKVEKVSFDLQTEKEQNIYMNNQSAQGEYDFEKLAELLPDIDVKKAGLTPDDLDLISVYAPDIEHGNPDDIVNDLDNLGKDFKEQKQIEREAKKELSEKPKNSENEEEKEKPAFDYKKVKQEQKEAAQQSVYEKYVTISFTTPDAKYLFMTKYRFDPELTIIKGEYLEARLEE